MGEDGRGLGDIPNDDKRKNGPDVWVYRWREYGLAGKVNRRGEMIGTVEKYPTKAAALRACEHLQLTANSDNH